jgi:hypothetical protein
MLKRRFQEKFQGLGEKVETSRGVNERNEKQTIEIRAADDVDHGGLA